MIKNETTQATNNNEGSTMKLPKHIEFWDVEPGWGYGDPQEVIVTLQYGFSFENGEHQGVRGFDGIAEAKYESARKRIYDCTCDECKKHLETDTPQPQPRAAR